MKPLLRRRCAYFLLAWLGTTAVLTAGPLPLFIPVEASVTTGPGADHADSSGMSAKRIRRAAIRPEALTPLCTQSANVIILNLFDDSPLTGLIGQVECTASGDLTASGALGETPLGSFVLVRRHNLVFATIRAPGRGVFDVRPDKDGTCLIRQMDEAAAPATACGMKGALLQPVTAKARGFEPADRPAGAAEDSPCPTAISPLAGYNCDDGATVDLMVYYTPAARIGAGGTPQIEGLIDLAVATTNTAFAASLITPRIRVIRKAMIDYTEAGPAGNLLDLERLTLTDDGYLDSVHAERDQYGADLISLWVQELSAGGMGFSLFALGPEDDGRYGFTVCRQDNGPFETLAHELGHNFGCQHDRQTNASGGFFNYSYGYREPGAAWKTIMAYPPGMTILNFSNPDVVYTGPFPHPGPTGVPGDDPNLSCNNALTINNTAWTVANFRPSAVASPPPSRLYVRASAPAGGNGHSWATPFRDLQDAICLAVRSRGTVTEIWTAAGTYKPDRGRNDRRLSFRLADGVSIYGGFAGTETQLAQRDIATHETILSGDIGAAGDTNDNTYHVINGSHLTASAVLDGFIITAGNANAPGFPNDAGGGMRSECGSPTIRNCTFRNNHATAGGAVENWHSSPTFIRCTFKNNSADQQAGAMHSYSSDASFVDCAFTANSAPYGGAMVNRQASNPSLSDCSFTGNQADWGGAMVNDMCNPTLTGCTFTQNQAAHGGGAMMSSGGEPHLSNCHFQDNSADFGGGAYSHSMCTAHFADCRFIANSAVSGAALYNYDASPTFAGCEFSDNRAAPGGGGVGAGAYNVVGSRPFFDRCTFNRNIAGYAAAGICNSTSPARLRNCTFTANTAPFGAALWNLDGSSIELVGCLFFGNVADFGGGGIHNTTGSAATLMNCVFSGNRTPYGDGGAICNLTASSNLVNCTLSNNTAGYNGGGITIDDADLTLNNSILWQNADQGGTGQNAQITRYSGVAAVGYSIIQGWNGLLGGAGNNTLNPQFIDADGADNLAGTPDDRLQPAPGSPAINTGSNAALPADILDVDNDADTTEPLPLDAAGRIRVLELIVDRGAYEHAPVIAADFDADGDVDLDDFGRLQSCTSGPEQSPLESACAPTDLDHDGDVDQSDFGLFQRCISGAGVPASPQCAD